MNGANKKMNDRVPHWQQILGVVLLLSVSLAFLVNGLMGHSFELYKLFGGGVFVLPGQQIAIGILIFGFTAGLLISEFIRKRKQETQERNAEQLDSLDEE